jgi:hypothetical protein
MPSSWPAMLKNNTVVFFCAFGAMHSAGSPEAWTERHGPLDRKQAERESESATGSGSADAGGAPPAWCKSGMRRGRRDNASGATYRRAPNDFTLQMFYGQGLEFPGFSQIIHWGPTRFSRVFQMVYWFASAPRPIHSSIIVKSPMPPRTLHSHPRHGSTTTISPSPHDWAAACCPSRHRSTTTTSAGAGWGWGADRPMSSAMSPPAGAPGWHTMRTHTSCCSAAAAVEPGTACPGSAISGRFRMILRARDRVFK